MHIFQNPEEYWTINFEITTEDIEFLFNVFLEEETPLTLRDLSQRLVRFRYEQERSSLRKQIEQGTIFQPRSSYEIGQKIVFPALSYAVGEVVGQRAGNNPEHGKFSVLKVTFEDGRTWEFAAQLSTPHTLNVDLDHFGTTSGDDSQLITDIMRDYGDDVAYALESALAEHNDVVYFAGRWFLRSLLADVGVAHLHLAEAVLVMNDGGPLDTPSILKEIDLPAEINPRLQAFSLDYALFDDKRFDEVGPSGQVLWCLRELEPPEVIQIPSRLQYQTIDYDWQLVDDDMAAIEYELDDELSNLRSPGDQPDSVTITLNFPHRRTGTLPLNSRVRHLFPTSYEAPRILMTLVDGQTDEEMPGWVVREHKYVYGLADFYRKHQLPVGTYLTVRKTDQPSRVIVDFLNHRPRSEWIRLIVPGNERQFTFENHKRAIGADYDELLVIGADDLAGVDALWAMPDERSRSLADLMRLMINELARLTPQHTVHLKTLYSAINVIKRCPPGPIFATLKSHSDFEHVGGPYWRLA